MNHPDIVDITARLFVIFSAIAIHEFCHCYFADLAGDPTPSYYGRLSLNPFVQFDPLGSIMIVLTTISGFGLGWGKPAPMDPRKMGNPRWDFFIAVAAGPISNVLQAVFYATILRFTMPGNNVLISSNPTTQFFQEILVYGVIINLGLALFNLIPIGPLDGQWLLGLLMPETLRLKFWGFQRRIGFFGVVALVILLDFTPMSLIENPIFSAFQILTGKRF